MAVKKSNKILYLNPSGFKYKNTKENTEDLDKSVVKELRRQIKKIITP